MLKKVVLLLTSILVVFLYTMTIRGHVGNPTPIEIDFNLNGSGQPFETSQERSRYAIILALVNYHRFDLGEYASMGTPDIGKFGGKFYSFFPPATSILAIPFYLVGTKYGIAQIATFLLVTLFAIATIIMMYKFAIKLGIHWSKAIFASLTFAFATNAWGYSVTFYAHLLSAFSLLAGIYFAALKPSSWQNALVVWLLYAFAIFVDFPNIFTYFPIALLVGLRLFELWNSKQTFQLSIKMSFIIGPIIFILCMGGYGYYNYIHFGNPLKLSNTIDRVKDLKNVDFSVPEKKDLEAVGALTTRKMLGGLYTFTISHDRGVLIYSPVVLLFIFGLIYLKNLEYRTKILLVAVPTINLLTYSMFGDPWGGWAYGSRYMIAIMPELIIIAAYGLDEISRQRSNLFKYLVCMVYSVVFVYSSSMALLSPLTTNVIPPSVEAGTFALADDYRINKEMLTLGHLNSYIYNTYYLSKLSGYDYYYLILVPLDIYVLTLIWLPSKLKKFEK